MKVRGPRAGSTEGRKGHQSPPGRAPRGGWAGVVWTGTEAQAGSRLWCRVRRLSLGSLCVWTGLARSLRSVPLKRTHTRVPFRPPPQSARLQGRVQRASSSHAQGLWGQRGCGFGPPPPPRTQL